MTHTHPIAALVLFVLVLCVSGDISAWWNPGARCVRTEDYILNVYPTCRPYIIVQNYTYVDELQPTRDATVNALAQTISSVNNCTSRSVQLICALAYRQCFEVDIPGYGPAAIGNIPCKEFCQLWHDDCSLLYAARGIPQQQAQVMLNCTNMSPYWGFGSPAPQPPRYNATVIITTNTSVYNGTVENLPCYDLDANIFAGYGTLLCPQGTHNDGPNSCALNCPEPLISDNEYDQAKLMLSIVGWFSFIGTTFVVISFLLTPKEKLGYPSVLSFFFTCCIMCLSFTFCLGSMVGHENMWCEDEHTPNRFGDGWCTIQGITYAYFTLAGGLWWLSISINLIATVVFRVKAASYEMFKVGKLKVSPSFIVQGVCHLLCWGIPLVVIIITLGNERLGYGGSDFWCSIHSGEDISFVYGSSQLTTEGSSDEQAIDIWNLLLLTIPMMTITLVGTILFIIVIVVALIRSKEGFLFFLHQWRLLGLLVLYIWIYSFVFSAHLQFSTQRKQQYEDYADYIDCLKVHSYSKSISECELPQRVNFALWFIASFNVAAGGFFVFLIFGTSKGVLVSWAKFILMVTTCGKKSLSTSHSDTSPRSGLQKVVGTVVSASGSVGPDMTSEVSLDEGVAGSSSSETDEDTSPRKDGDDDDETASSAEEVLSTIVTNS